MSPQITTARRAAARASWLGKLSEALDIADKLTVELSREARHVEALAALAARIALIRAEIDALRLGRFNPADEVGPEWSILLASNHTPCGTSPPPPNSSR